MKGMPAIPMDTLSESARTYADLITVKGTLRASKPTVKRDSEITGSAAYVWRMVAFQVSPNPKHQCMPVCATFDLMGEYEHRKYLAEELDLIVKEIVDAVPPQEWHGIIRWGQAFGQIGTPRYTNEGAVIYR